MIWVGIESPNFKLKSYWWQSGSLYQVARHELLRQGGRCGAQFAAHFGLSTGRGFQGGHQNGCCRQWDHWKPNCGFLVCKEKAIFGGLCQSWWCAELLVALGDGDSFRFLGSGFGWQLDCRLEKNLFFGVGLCLDKMSKYTWSLTVYISIIPVWTNKIYIFF